MHKMKQTAEKERLMAVALVRIWGVDNLSLTFMKRRRIKDATCRQLAYDHGFPKLLGGSMLRKWTSTLTSGVKGVKLILLHLARKEVNQ